MAKHLTKERILDGAQARFFRFGYRKVTMDEIAGDLVMSKNTIYRHFAGKVDIARALLERLKQEIDAELTLIEESNKDPVEVITKSVFFIQQRFKPWFKYFLGDIKVELPGLWNAFIEFRRAKIAAIKDVIEEGMKKGKFRKVNAALAVRIYMGAIDYILNPEFLEREGIAFPDAIEGVLDIWMSGVLPNNDK